MKRAGGGTVITLRGTPQRLSAVVAFGTPGRAVLPVTLKLAAEPTVLRARIAPFGPEGSEIRLQLPPETPPGSYRGKASVDGKRRDILVEVEPVVRLRVHPRQTSLAAEPGGRVEFGLTLVNAGNVPFEVTKSEELDLDDAVAEDRALGRALRAELGAGESRADRFFEELRADHGGVARLAVVRGAGALQPGQSRELAVVVDVPVTVRPGHSYAGSWEFGGVNHVIEIEVTKGTQQPARRGRRKA